MKIYVSAHILERKRANVVKRTLTKLGHNVISTWHVRREPRSKESFVIDAKLRLQEIDAADMVVFLTPIHDYARESQQAFELGYAVGGQSRKRKRKLYRVGVALFAFVLSMHSYNDERELYEELS